MIFKEQWQQKGASSKSMTVDFCFLQNTNFIRHHCVMSESMSSVSPGTLKNNQNNNSKDIMGRQNLRLKVWAEEYK